MKTYNEIDNILKNVVDNNSNLSLADTTTGISIIGFADSQEIDKVKKELAGSLKNLIGQCRNKKRREEFEQTRVVSQILIKEDGKNMWIVRDTNFYANHGCFGMCDSNANRQFYIKSSYESEAEFIQIELVDMGMLDDCTSFDDIQDLAKKYGELWKAIESLNDDEVVALDEESWHFEKVKRYVTSYHEDRYTYAIALSIV